MGKTSRMMIRRSRKERPREVSTRVGSATNAQRITVNLSAEISDHLREIADRCRVSESSVVEIALRQLFRRINPLALAAFLHEQGACLRRRKP
jgi:hypothetical protein